MAVTLTESITYKRLVAAGNDKIFYEGIDVAAGTMTELAAADGDIDTSDQLQMFEAYQKVFVVNGANLKIADFVNTKLTHTALTTAHAHGDILTQDQGSSNIAYMVVDFTNTAKTMTYGYAYYAESATAFDTTSSIVGSGDGTGFTPTAVTAKPHWYDYTVYPGDAAGELPNKAYLGCLYRGRIVLSGNPEKPFQWYMARQGNPFDLAYTANDAQSPVSGGNSDAGELGDIVRALIPFKDDYLIFGCASQMWILTGDPAFGGVISEMSLTTGIFGANSFCFDSEDRMYFFGNNGIYRTTIPGNPICISSIRLPDLVNDEAADPSTHRITMSYDRKRHGINVFITKLSDGTNSNYWYDLRVLDEDGIGGFFPESIPEECGAYSAFYYNANSSTYRDLIVGCKDGYLRKFDNTAKSDDIGGSDEAISSYVTIGPLRPIGPGMNGIISGLNVTLSGGASAGSQTDSSDVTMKIFSALSAESVIEKMTANTSFRLSKTISAPGVQRGSTIQRKMRDAFFGIRMENSTAAQSWSLEEITLLGKPSGRIK